MIILPTDNDKRKLTFAEVVKGMSDDLDNVSVKNTMTIPNILPTPPPMGQFRYVPNRCLAAVDARAARPRSILNGYGFSRPIAESDESDKSSDEQTRDESVAERYEWVKCKLCGADKAPVRKVNLKSHQVRIHHTCLVCDVPFQSRANLIAHMNSSMHRPAKVRCLSGCNDCRRRFINLPAALAHLEVGKCSSELSPDEIGLWIIQHDPENVFTDVENSKKFLEENGNKLRKLETSKSDDWNAWRHRYVCKICKEGFRSFNWLKAHLASSVHDLRIYKCPVCEKTFPAISSLGKHVEANRCGAKSVIKYPFSTAILKLITTAKEERKWIEPRKLNAMAYKMAYPTIVENVAKLAN